MTNNAGDAMVGRSANSIARVLDGGRTWRFGLIVVAAVVVLPTWMVNVRARVYRRHQPPRVPKKAAQVKPINPKELF